MPVIAEMCRRRRVVFTYYDFRWGITQDSGNDDDTVAICLDAVNASDAFVGLLGNRYGWYIHDDACSCDNNWAHTEGNKQLHNSISVASAKYPWVKKYKKRSVTELEFRQAIYQTKIPDILVMCKGEPELQSSMMKALRTEVSSVVPAVREYTSADDVVGLVTTALQDVIERRYPRGSTPTKVQAQRNEMDDYMCHVTECYYGRSPLLYKLKTFVTGSNSVPVVVMVCC